ncbi:CCR4-NOT transcription complex subunit 7 [Folsomia candida]|uniref:poly(A)-specific ribonuclease n=1 Tax=Folsomia candida TaxID=158441 RepID=A0A226EN10_FOLCA|nr:CCR4-NOT transcription complex subunit 7 [Folsomia candida]
MTSNNSHIPSGTGDIEQVYTGSGGNRNFLRPIHPTHSPGQPGICLTPGMLYNQQQHSQQQQQLNNSIGNATFLHQQQQQHSVVAAAYAPYQQQYANSNNSNTFNNNPTTSSSSNAPGGRFAAMRGSGSGLLGSGDNGLLGAGGERMSGSSGVLSAAQMLLNGVQSVQNVNVSNNCIQISTESSTGIRDVWSFNLREEFRQIRSLSRNGYNYVAVDTEFPGAPVRPVGTFESPSEYQYQTIRVNCNSLRLIQLGFTLLDECGNLPPGVCTWQFNFKFSLSDDMYANDSIELLQSSGIQFHRMESDGIDPFTFSELLYSSDLVLNDGVRWISFHSGYDFGYMYRLLRDQPVPPEVGDFFDILKLFFPFLYDYLMKSCRSLKGGLQELADELGVTRLGPSHQAGSDSLLTGLAYFKMREMYFENMIDDEMYNGRLFGLTGTYYPSDEGDTVFYPLPPDAVVINAGKPFVDPTATKPSSSTFVPAEKEHQGESQPQTEKNEAITSTTTTITTITSGVGKSKKINTEEKPKEH